MNMQEKRFRLDMQSAESIPRDCADPIKRGPPEGAQDDAGQVQEEVPRSGATHGLDEGPHAAVDGHEGESEGQSQGSDKRLMALMIQRIRDRYSSQNVVVNLSPDAFKDFIGFCFTNT